MSKFKKERGITLIALIITIIILVILAAVSIRAVTNMKIVDYAINGSQNYVAAGKNENKMLDDTASFLDNAVAKVEAAKKTDLEKLQEYFIRKTDCFDDGAGTFANKEPIMDASTSIKYISSGPDHMDENIWVYIIKYNNNYYKLVMEWYGETRERLWATKVEEAKKFTFTIDGIEYTAVERMSWISWLDSEFKTGNFDTSGNDDSSYIYTSGRKILKNGPVCLADEIVQGQYTTSNGIE